MIKLPKEVNQIMKTLEKSGFEAYAAGSCVRESIMGRAPLDWDIVTAARLADMKKLLPEAEVFDEKGSILRLDKTQGGDEDGIIVDIATYRDRRVKNGERFCSSIEEDLAGRPFTIEAMADNPAGALQDPYQGREDIKAKLVRTVRDPGEAFEEEPHLMMEAILLAAELDFDLPKYVYDAMLEKSEQLEKVDVGQRRELFKDIIVASHAGKGLRMLASANLMPALVGEVAQSMSTRQKRLFSELADGIDQLKAVVTRRLGLFYMCFEKNGLQAIEKLEYDPKTHQHLTDALTQMEKIYFIRDKFDLKEYIYKVGMERYDYVHNLAKAHRIVYQEGNVKVQNRHYLMEEIIANKEPIFIEDLAIGQQDILDAGITDSEEKAMELLQLLPVVVHRKPGINKKDTLLDRTRKYSKNKLRAALRGVDWIK